MIQQISMLLQWLLNVLIVKIKKKVYRHTQVKFIYMYKKIVYKSR